MKITKKRFQAIVGSASKWAVNESEGLDLGDPILSRIAVCTAMMDAGVIGLCILSEAGDESDDVRLRTNDLLAKVRELVREHVDGLKAGVK